MLKMMLVSLMMLIGFNGCVAKNDNNEVIGIKGIISGATYKPEILVNVYEVAQKGVVTFMTEEQIEKFKLDKVDAAIKYAYSVTIEGKKIIKEPVATK